MQQEKALRAGGDCSEFSAAALSIETLHNDNVHFGSRRLDGPELYFAFVTCCVLYHSSILTLGSFFPNLKVAEMVLAN